MAFPHLLNHRLIAILILLLAGLVYCPFCTTPVAAQTKPAREKNKTTRTELDAATARHKILYETSRLPEPVRQMCEHILAAVHSGNIEELRLAIEWNELRPQFAAGSDEDPIAYFRAISADGEGLEILAILSRLLSAGFVAIPQGQDIENNLVYVWPYFAEMDLKQLTPAQKVELLQLVPVQSFKRMMETGKYTGYRLSIGADGTWHEFVAAQ